MAMSENAKKFLDMLQAGESLTMRRYQNEAGATVGYSINGVRVSGNTYFDVEGLGVDKEKDCMRTVKGRVNYIHSYCLRRKY